MLMLAMKMALSLLYLTPPIIDPARKPAMLSNAAGDAGDVGYLAMHHSMQFLGYHLD